MVYIMIPANSIGLHWQEEITIVLQAISWDLIITVHTKDGYYPGQKVFTRDMILQ